MQRYQNIIFYKKVDCPPMEGGCTSSSRIGRSSGGIELHSSVIELLSKRNRPPSNKSATRMLSFSGIGMPSYGIGKSSNRIGLPFMEADCLPVEVDCLQIETLLPLISAGCHPGAECHSGKRQFRCPRHLLLPPVQFRRKFFHHISTKRRR